MRTAKKVIKKFYCTVHSYFALISFSINVYMTFYHLFSITAGVVGGRSLKMQELIMTMALLCVIYTYLFFLRKLLLTLV
jgi:hypothetical protein